jgi:predicted house-cleaning noncanonical NTP pyrophosphatase (MazG superfamily)
MKKLVRDRIPEILKRTAEKVSGETLNKYLNRKIGEEITEYLEAVKEKDFSKMTEEAADVVSVMIAIFNKDGLCWEEIEKEIVRKSKEKGGFGGGFVMEFPE